MTEAHIASILPIRNRVLAADEHTTFLAHYDLNEHDVLRNVKALGSEKVQGFNGNNYIDCGNPEHLQILGDLTVEMWIKPFDFSARRNPIAKAYGGEYTITQELDASISCYYGSSGVNGGTYHGLRSSLKLALNQWNHIVMIRNMTTMRMSIYINGVFSNDVAISQVTKASSLNLFIGQGYVSRYNGEIRDVRIWAKAKTAEQIVDEMHVIKNESGLRAHWPLTEGDGDIARDLSPFSNDGIIVGGSNWVVGNSVFTLRPKEGKFGGGIAIEEGTVNQIINATAGFASPWGAWDPSAIINLPNQEVFGMPCTVINMKDRTNSTGPLNALHRVTTMTNGASNTLSFYAKIPDESAVNEGYIRAYILSYVDYPIKKGEWTRIELTQTATATAHTVHITHHISATNVLIALPQVENKPFATSFVNGSRKNGNLLYPYTISPNQFTINFWSKTNGWVGSYPWYLSISPDGGAGGLNRVYFRPSSATTIAGGRVVGGVANGVPTGTIADIRDWHMYTLTSDNTQMKIYQDGQLIVESTSISLLSEGDYLLNMNSSSGSSSVIIDELRIDKIARTDEEIAAWYESNSPFWPRGIYRKPY